MTWALLNKNCQMNFIKFYNLIFDAFFSWKRAKTKIFKFYKIKMSSRKLQNDEERCKKLLDIFNKDKEFYMLKEVEKLAKEKGVTQKYVKDSLQSLIDSGRIESDKIGNTIYYWSFPVSAEGIKEKGDEMKARNKELNEQLDKLNAALSEKMNEEKVIWKGNLITQLQIDYFHF